MIEQTKAAAKLLNTIKELESSASVVDGALLGALLGELLGALLGTADGIAVGCVVIGP